MYELWPTKFENIRDELEGNSKKSFYLIFGLSMSFAHAKSGSQRSGQSVEILQSKDRVQIRTTSMLHM